jgi:membrane protease YdiL (CAAX protease family)
VAIGLLLGTAGLNTESLYPPLTMHALLNLVATLEAA